MIKFIVGAMVGGVVSFFFFALLTASKENKTEKQIKAEVLKELKNRIHEKLHKAEMHGNFEPVVTAEMFDSVVKEMEDSK
jgi:gas vesicle protein